MSKSDVRNCTSIAMRLHATTLISVIAIATTVSGLALGLHQLERQHRALRDLDVRRTGASELELILAQTAFHLVRAVYTDTAANAPTLLALCEDLQSGLASFRGTVAGQEDPEIQAFIAAAEPVITDFRQDTVRLLTSIPESQRSGPAARAVAGELLDRLDPIRESAGAFVRSTNAQIEEHVAQVQRFQVMAGAVAVAALIAMTGLIALVNTQISRTITGPLARLIGFTRRFAAGDSNVTADASGRDELSELAASFNEMVQKHRKNAKEIEAQWQQLEAQQLQVIALNEELLRASNLAEMASRSKSEFLANMSHEIRTPMTAICGFADVLEDDIACCTVCTAHADCAVRRRNSEHVATIRHNGKYLLELINEILDLSKVEAGKLDLEQIRCGPLQIAAEVRQLMQVRAASKGLSLEVESAGLVPETILSDPTRLRQALINLVGNSLKFTDCGGVRIVVALAAGAEADHPRLQFDVIDTGIGISPEQTVGLFQPFSQADNSVTRRYGGTGLGLALSKRLAELLGGGLELVASEPGAGTTFRLTVATGPLPGVAMVEGGPLAALPAVAEARPAAHVASLSGCRVLLAEDGEDNQRLISLVLRKAGAEVEVAPDGQVAVERAWAAREEGRPFDVILMDMQMPVMDGFSATGLLRRRGYDGPIIALTAHAMASDREKCLAAGCDDYASKPIDRRQLIDTIAARRQAAPQRTPTI